MIPSHSATMDTFGQNFQCFVFLFCRSTTFRTYGQHTDSYSYLPTVSKWPNMYSWFINYRHIKYQPLSLWPIPTLQWTDNITFLSSSELVAKRSTKKWSLKHLLPNANNKLASMHIGVYAVYKFIPCYKYCICYVATISDTLWRNAINVYREKEAYFSLNTSISL